VCLAAGLIAAMAGAAHARPDLYSNGPFVTGPGPGGSDLSLMQNSLLCQIYGYNCQLIPTNSRTADDVTVDAPGGWDVSSVVIHAFQTGSGTVSTFTQVNLRIWSGRPGDPGSAVIWGNTTTNLLAGSEWTNCYRAAEIDQNNTTRPIFRVEAAISPALHLAPGTYWLDWQASGTLASGPWSVPVTYLGLHGAPGGNARAFFNGAWIDCQDCDHARQDMAFIVRGTVAGGTPPCYANCDQSTVAPVLNVQDFACFLNRFAAGESAANCDQSTAPPVLNVQDFSCFLNSFAAGCS
jgi:hypothetical protein